jgi:hypothetical protein
MALIVDHVDELHRLNGALRQCIAALASKHGDAPAMRRVANDAERIQNGIDRLGIDAGELQCGLTTPERTGEMIPVPDTEYDSEFWRDVDHEGVGGQSGACERGARTRKRR